MGQGWPDRHALGAPQTTSPSIQNRCSHCSLSCARRVGRCAGRTRRTRRTHAQPLAGHALGSAGAVALETPVRLQPLRVVQPFVQPDERLHPARTQRARFGQSARRGRRSDARQSACLLTACRSWFMRTFCGCTTPVPCAVRPRAQGCRPPVHSLSAPLARASWCRPRTRHVEHSSVPVPLQARQVAWPRSSCDAAPYSKLSTRLPNPLEEACRPAPRSARSSGRHLRPAAAPAHAPLPRSPPLVLPARRAPASSWLHTSGNRRGSPHLDTRACAWPPQSLCCMARPRQGTGDHPCAGALAAATEPASWGPHRSLEHEGGASGWTQ